MPFLQVPMLIFGINSVADDSELPTTSPAGRVARTPTNLCSNANLR
jgi:hypothetical protein